MRSLLDKVGSSPAATRAMPFVVFVALTALQGRLGASSAFWVYGCKTLVGLALVLWMYSRVPEMRWAVSPQAIGAGILVLAIWVGLDPYYPQYPSGTEAWNPHRQFPGSPALAWGFVVLRLVGSTLIVPPLEEVFFRSFLYRYLIQPDFLAVPLRTFSWTALLFTCGIFAAEHSQWLAGLFCGLIYQGLVLRKGRLGDAITAHAITNFLLALWVIYRGAWQFW